MIGRIDRLSRMLARVAAILGTLGLVGLTLVICIDVVGRYLGRPLYGAQDLTSMGLVVVIFGGMAICDRAGGHIVVDVFESLFPTWLKRMGDVAAALLGAVIFALIAYTAWNSAALSRMLGLASNIIDLPKAWFQYFIVAAALVTALGMGLRTLALLLGAPPPAHERLAE